MLWAYPTHKILAADLTPHKQLVTPCSPCSLALPSSVQDCWGTPTAPCQRVKYSHSFPEGGVVLAPYYVVLSYFPNIQPWCGSPRLVILFSLASAFPPWAPYSASCPCALAWQKADMNTESCCDGLARPLTWCLWKGSFRVLSQTCGSGLNSGAVCDHPWLLPNFCSSEHIFIMS